MELMKFPITSYSVTSEYLRFLSKLSLIDCFKLNYSDMKCVEG